MSQKTQYLTVKFVIKIKQLKENILHMTKYISEYQNKISMLAYLVLNFHATILLGGGWLFYNNL